MLPLAGIAALFLVLAGVALAQTGGGYDLSWSKITGGGGSSSGASYVLHGSIGQPMAGQVSGSGYVIDGGFWGGAALEGIFKAWLPGLNRNP
jgi:hypothetical protein